MYTNITRILQRVYKTPLIQIKIFNQSALALTRPINHNPPPKIKSKINQWSLSPSCRWTRRCHGRSRCWARCRRSRRSGTWWRWATSSSGDWRAPRRGTCNRPMIAPIVQQTLFPFFSLPLEWNPKIQGSGGFVGMPDYYRSTRARKEKGRAGSGIRVGVFTGSVSGRTRWVVAYRIII